MAHVARASGSLPCVPALNMDGNVAGDAGSVLAVEHVRVHVCTTARVHGRRDACRKGYGSGRRKRKKPMARAAKAGCPRVRSGRATRRGLHLRAGRHGRARTSPEPPGPRIARPCPGLPSGFAPAGHVFTPPGPAGRRGRQTRPARWLPRPVQRAGRVSSGARKEAPPGPLPITAVPLHFFPEKGLCCPQIVRRPVSAAAAPPRGLGRHGESGRRRRPSQGGWPCIAPSVSSPASSPRPGSR
jgi:hypothetical protein